MNSIDLKRLFQFVKPLPPLPPRSQPVNESQADLMLAISNRTKKTMDLSEAKLLAPGDGVLVNGKVRTIETMKYVDDGGPVLHLIGDPPGTYHDWIVCTYLPERTAATMDTNE